MRNLVNDIKAISVKASGAVTATGASDIIDTQGYHDITWLLNLTAVGAADADNTLTFSVQEGDSALGYDFVAVTRTGVVHVPNQLLNPLVVDDTTDFAATLQMIGFTPGVKRYCRLIWTEVGTVNVTFSGIALLYGAEDMPVSQD